MFFVTDMKIKPEIKKLWIENLRSGEYHQTVGCLKAEKIDDLEVGYCCLGVLCETVSKMTGIPFDEFRDEDEELPGDKLIKLVKEDEKDLCASFDDAWKCKPQYVDNSGCRYLSLFALNDEGMSFDKIADIIEEEF